MFTYSTRINRYVYILIHYIFFVKLITRGHGSKQQKLYDTEFNEKRQLPDPQQLLTGIVPGGSAQGTSADAVDRRGHVGN